MADEPRPKIRSLEGGRVEVELSGGRVYKGDPMGPEAWSPILALNPIPQEPKDTITNDAGREVEISVAEDDPRYVAYLEDYAAYNERIKEVSWLNFFGKTLEVPEGWDVPLGSKWIGVELSDDPAERLVQYVRMEVVKSPEDDELLARAIRNEITKEEMDAYRRLFPRDEEVQVRQIDPAA